MEKVFFCGVISATWGEGGSGRAFLMYCQQYVQHAPPRGLHFRLVGCTLQGFTKSGLFLLLMRRNVRLENVPSTLRQEASNKIWSDLYSLSKLEFFMDQESGVGAHANTKNLPYTRLYYIYSILVGNSSDSSSCEYSRLCWFCVSNTRLLYYSILRFQWIVGDFLSFSFALCFCFCFPFLCPCRWWWEWEWEWEWSLAMATDPGWFFCVDA